MKTLKSLAVVLLVLVVSSAAHADGLYQSPDPVTTVAASGTSQTVTFPTSGSVTYDVTLTGNCVFTLATGSSAGKYATVRLILRQDATAGRSPTLPTGVKWPGGVSPTPNTVAGNIDVFTFSTPDNDTTVIGSY